MRMNLMTRLSSTTKQDLQPVFFCNFFSFHLFISSYIPFFPSLSFFSLRMAHTLEIDTPNQHISSQTANNIYSVLKAHFPALTLVHATAWLHFALYCYYIPFLVTKPLSLHSEDGDERPYHGGSEGFVLPARVALVFRFILPSSLLCRRFHHQQSRKVAVSPRQIRTIWPRYVCVYGRVYTRNLTPLTTLHFLNAQNFADVS